MPERYPPDDPREWLNRARSNLMVARAEGPAIYLEDLCFNAQQAAEKAIKALLIQHNVEFPNPDEPEPNRLLPRITRISLIFCHFVLIRAIRGNE